MHDHLMAQLVALKKLRRQTPSTSATGAQRHAR
jgi:hypothetical protein